MFSCVYEDTEKLKEDAIDMKSVIAKRFIEISIEVYNQPLLGII